MLGRGGHEAVPPGRRPRGDADDVPLSRSRRRRRVPVALRLDGHGPNSGLTGDGGGPDDGDGLHGDAVVPSRQHRHRDAEAGDDGEHAERDRIPSPPPSVKANRWNRDGRRRSGCAAALILADVPEIDPEGAELAVEVRALHADALGEFANMIGGNLKSVLPRGVSLSMPSVVEGSHYSLHVHRAKTNKRLAFDGPDGPFWVTLLETENQRE